MSIAVDRTRAAAHDAAMPLLTGPTRLATPRAAFAPADTASSPSATGGIALARVDPRDPIARTCLAAYYAELDRRLSGGFDVSLSRDPEAEDMIPPRGAFFVAVASGAPVGCAGLKGHHGPADPWGEVKRVWVDPTMRGNGLARRLMGEVEKAAAMLGFATLRLDTNTALPEPIALYRRLGWTEIPRFNDDPYPDTFFEKKL